MADSPAMDMPTLHGDGLTLRPVRDDDLPLLAAVVGAEGCREWWGPIGDEATLEDDLRNGGSAFTIEADAAVAGWMGVDRAMEGDWVQASLDIMLGPAFQGRGLGPAALRAAIAWLISLGHHRVTIDPAVANARAIAAYRSVGFRPVGVMRRYEMGADGTWHDNLLMDLLAEELEG